MDRTLSELRPNPNNPRGPVVVDDSLRELAASIKEHGVIQPILVTPHGTIVAGHRRCKAADLAGLKTVPITERVLTESQQIQIMLVENLQREDLSTSQIALAYKALSQHGLSIAEIGKATGFSAGSISKHLDILRLPRELHSCFDDRSLPLGSVPLLIQLKPAEQLRIGKEAAEKHWLIAEIASAVQAIKNPAQTNGHKSQKPDEPRIQLREMISQLEDMDEILDEHGGFRPTQTLLRQAASQLIEGV